MTPESVMNIGRLAMETTLLVGAPLLLVSLLVGLIISVFQAATQINEATLTFIPKVLAIGFSILLFGPWMLRVMTSFTTNLYENMNLHIR